MYSGSSLLVIKIGAVLTDECVKDITHENFSREVEHRPDASLHFIALVDRPQSNSTTVPTHHPYALGRTRSAIREPPAAHDLRIAPVDEATPCRHDNALVIRYCHRPHPFPMRSPLVDDSCLQLPRAIPHAVLAGC